MLRINIDDKHFDVDEKKYKIETIAVYGSLVNGEFDEKSDIDFLIIIPDCPRSQKKYITKSIASQMDVPVKWLTVYCKSEFSSICASGDYFFWYFKLYCAVLYSKTEFIERCFKYMPIYTDVKSTMYHDLKIINSNIKKYKLGELTAERTMNNIAHFTRNACINLCYLHGILEFGKYIPVEKCMSLEAINMPFTYDDYLELYQNKRDYIYDTQNFTLEGDADEYVKLWETRYRQLIAEVLKAEKLKLTKNFSSPLLPYKGEKKTLPKTDLV
ncbi:MAG: nucleotidyltransferase family protein [Turicibacter sp.]